ncbi:hypothetical protein JMN32_05340 [Fulvivirga sp. 29W222]|uniref:Uncharacterized protein n=1 Tax=Fulvivirga marina TaxID=2494733 RepID=A0A937FW67_9BACT|nr:hypothetical protein [Fulvivirga marina]MBL6445722.1 hypothetical protein [Fulvivirga marina]
MTEQFAIHYAPQRVKERGFEKFRLDYRDISVNSKETREIMAYNEIWFVVEAGPGIRVNSDYGLYSPFDPFIEENMHEHGDRIVIENISRRIDKVKFIVIVLEA